MGNQVGFPSFFSSFIQNQNDRLRSFCLYPFLATFLAPCYHDSGDFVPSWVKSKRIVRVFNQRFWL